MPHLRELIPEPVLGLSRRLRGLRHLPPRGIHEFESMGFKWRGPAESIVVQGAFWGEWEPGLTAFLQSNIRPGMTALDVGANFGFFTLLLSRLVGSTGHVVAFEPTCYWREFLNWNIAQNRASNVTVLDYGLSDSDGKHGITIGESSASMHDQAAFDETIQLRCLDNVWPQLGLPNLDFIKVDIDGHEPAFLRGAAQTLAAYRPIITLEFAPWQLKNANSNADEERAILLDLGYELRTEAGQSITERMFSQLCQTQGFNAVAIPD